MTTNLDLGAFLRSRRAALSPADAGIASYGARRVAGLRREELAELAGVSLTYYTRLEQGHATNASDAVLDALSRALRLDEAERAHLFSLARGRASHPVADEPYRARPSTLRLIDAMADVPTVLLARNQDVLAWNRLGHALVAAHLPLTAPADGPLNWTRLLFLDAGVRALYRDWAQEATRGVASLRFVAAQFADDPHVAATIDGLRTDSAEFDALWREQPVELCTTGTKRLRHPRLGELDVEYEVLHLPEGTGQRLLTHHAIPGSAAADALALLASTTL